MLEWSEDHSTPLGIPKWSSKNLLAEVSTLPEQALGTKWDNYTSLPYSPLTRPLSSLRVNRMNVVEPGPGTFPET